MEGRYDPSSIGSGYNYPDWQQPPQLQPQWEGAEWQSQPYQQGWHQGQQHQQQHQQEWVENEWQGRQQPQEQEHQWQQQHQHQQQPAGWESHAPHQQYWEDQRQHRTWKPPQEMEKEDWAHYCEPCDKGFYSYRKYLEHCEEHIYCPVPGCNFLCRKEYKMELHKILLHDRNDVNLEDTEKYLEERKKKYPTRERIEEAKKIEELKQQRGQKGAGKKGSKDSTAGDYGHRGQKGGGKGKGKGTKGPADYRARPPLYYKCRLCGKPGHFTEHCWQQPDEQASAYDAPEESDARRPPADTAELNVKVAKEEEEEEAEAALPNPSMSPEEEKRLKREMKRQLREEKYFKLAQQRRRRKPSLWEKLTKSEVLREQSLLLQCFRYFVLTDFLKKDVDWVQFVSHSMKEDLVDPRTVEPCAVRQVILPEGVVLGTRKLEQEHEPAAKKRRKQEEEESSDSDTSEGGSSSDSDSNSNSENAAAVLSELEEARRRVALLEEQLKTKAKTKTKQE